MAFLNKEKNSSSNGNKERVPGNGSKHVVGGSGSVGRALASNSRGPRFESSHWQKLHSMFTFNCIETTKL